MRRGAERARPTQDERLRANDRVKRREDFVRLQSGGRRVHTPHFVVLLGPRDDDASRVGVTVTRKIGGAVERNRVKRLVREVFRRNRDLFPSGQDIVFIARNGAFELSYEEVLAEVTNAGGAMRGAAERNRKRARGASC